MQDIIDKMNKTIDHKELHDLRTELVKEANKACNMHSITLTEADWYTVLNQLNDYAGNIMIAHNISSQLYSSLLNDMSDSVE